MDLRPKSATVAKAVVAQGTIMMEMKQVHRLLLKINRVHRAVVAQGTIIMEMDRVHRADHTVPVHPQP